MQLPGVSVVLRQRPDPANEPVIGNRGSEDPFGSHQPPNLGKSIGDFGPRIGPVLCERKHNHFRGFARPTLVLRHVHYRYVHASILKRPLRYGSDRPGSIGLPTEVDPDTKGTDSGGNGIIAKFNPD
jgi:hypothetical protein